MDRPKTMLLCAAAALLLGPVPARGAASEWSVNPQSRVRLISPWQVASREGELILGLHFRLAPGWHAYWKNSGDAGFPPAVTFQPAEALGTPEILWPTPQRFDLPGGLVAFGYEDEVVYPVRATLWPNALPAPETPADGSLPGAVPFFIKADLDYLVCKIDCVPYRYTLTLEQPLGERFLKDPETAPLLRTWLDRVPRTLAEAPGIKVSTLLNTGRPGGPELEISLVGVEAQPGRSDLFLETNEALDAGRPRLKALTDGVIFHVPMKPRVADRPLPGKLVLAWTASSLTRKGEHLDLEDRREVQVLAAAAPAPAKGPAGRDRLPRLLVWAFLGGALLNLAPTVLALLAGEALELRRGGGSGVREGAAAAATGVVGASWVLAALALAVRRAGLPVGWGAQAQEPAVGALLAVASALLALNLWGLIDLPLPRAESARQGTGRHLLAGLFTVPLALAWSVPMLREPLGYAAGRGPAAVCIVFAVAGLGLALPYLILALVPSALRTAPGAGIPRLREGLGFLAGAGTFWTLHALSRQVSPEGLAWIELSLLAMALLAWLRAREGSGRALRLALALGIAVCAAGALWLADDNRLAVRQTAELSFTPSAPAGADPQPTSGG
jgi:suppressor for copper-sensitivity B